METQSSPSQTMLSTGPTLASNQLQTLGLTKAASLLKARNEACERWGMAYAHFPFITPDQVAAFHTKCRKEYRTSPKGYRMEKHLTFTPLKDYPHVPPSDVLAKLKNTQDLKVFDTFEIAHIEWQEIIPDPILFGRIKDCPDYFLIAQWGKDVSFEDLHT